MLSAGVVHTFLDVVPALALGVPDAAMAASALPGHRLVIAGRGREALRLSALDRGAAVELAVPLAIPLTRLMESAYPVVRAHLSLVLALVVGFLLLTEPTLRTAVGGLVAFALSGALGALTLDVSPDAPLAVGGMLTPPVRRTVRRTRPPRRRRRRPLPRVVGRTDYRRLSVGVVTLLVGLSFLFTGVVVFAVATAVGLVPPRLGTRRVHLMGVLVVPLALGL